MERVCENIIKYGIYICLFLPLVLGWKIFLFPFVFTKILFFQVIIEVIFIFWLILILFYKKRVNFSLFSLSILIFLAILFITSIFGLNFQKSFFSNQDRMTGLFTLIHFFIFFLILGIFEKKEEWLKLFKISVICSLLISLVALYQKINPAFLNPAFPVYPLQIYSTIGNPLFLSSYLLFNIFFALFLVLNEDNKKWKICWFIILLINLVTLLFTAAISAIFAMFFGGLTFFFLYLKELKSKFSLKFLSYLFAGLIILVVLFISFGQESLIFQKFSRLFLPTGSLAVRIDLWQVGLKAFLTAPFSGFGWENFDLIYFKFYDPKFYLRLIPFFDRSHNSFIDVLSLGGIFGFLSYIIIFFFAFQLLKKRWAEKAIDSLESSIFQGILISYLAFIFFNFDHFSSYLMFFFVLGYLNRQSTNKTNLEINKFPSLMKLKYLLIFFFIPVIILALAFNFKIALANFYSLKVISSFKSREVSAIFENFQKAKSYQVLQDTSTLALIAEYFSKISRIKQEGIEDRDLIGIFRLFEPVFQEGLKKESPNLNQYIRLGNFFRDWSRIEKTKLEEAEKTFKKALELFPNYPGLYFSIAQIYNLKGDHQSAISFAQQGVKLSPESPQAHFNLGLAYLFGDKENKFKEAIKEVTKLGKEIVGGYTQAPDYYIEIFEIYFVTEKWDKIIILADEISKLESNPYLHQYLANLYKVLGEKEKAEKEAFWIMENYPEFREATLEFLKTLSH